MIQLAQEVWRITISGLVFMDLVVSSGSGRLNLQKKDNFKAVELTKGERGSYLQACVKGSTMTYEPGPIRADPSMDLALEIQRFDLQAVVKGRKGSGPCEVLKRNFQWPLRGKLRIFQMGRSFDRLGRGLIVLVRDDSKARA